MLHKTDGTIEEYKKRNENQKRNSYNRYMFNR